MTKALTAILRIVVVAAAVVVGLIVGFGIAIRQPNLGSEPFPDGPRADPARLEAHVRFLATTDPPRSWEHPEGLERAADYVAAAFARTGAKCSEQAYRTGLVDSENLIARFGPEAGPRVIVGAHYDAFGGLPGADDNASGVAGLLELARLLDRRRLASPVELVAFSTEEPPFFGGPGMGSAVHAGSLVRSRVPVRAMICLEMIGYFTPRQPNQPWLLHLIYPRKGDFIALVGRWRDRALVRRAKRCFRGASDVPVVSYSGPVVVGADLSDHRNYWLAGYPALMVSDTAFLRNPNYHGAGDTPDTLDYRRLAGVVDGVLSVVVHLANHL